jgi:hypothetical protein
MKNTNWLITSNQCRKMANHSPCKSEKEVILPWQESKTSLSPAGLDWYCNGDWFLNPHRPLFTSEIKELVYYISHIVVESHRHNVSWQFPNDTRNKHKNHVLFNVCLLHMYNTKERPNKKILSLLYFFFFFFQYQTISSLLRVRIPTGTLDSFMWGSYPASLQNVGNSTQLLVNVP